MFSPLGRQRLIRAVGTGAFLALCAPGLGTGVAAADPAPPPNCTAADMAGIASGVAANTSGYLFTHPDVNDFFTSLRGRPRDEVPDAVNEFFDAHPQEHTELRAIRQPMTDFRTRCGLPEQMELGG